MTALIISYFSCFFNYFAYIPLAATLLREFTDKCVLDIEILIPVNKASVYL